MFYLVIALTNVILKQSMVQLITLCGGIRSEAFRL